MTVVGVFISYYFLIKDPSNKERVPKREKNLLNIARGTTDPEIDSETWTKFSDHGQHVCNAYFSTFPLV